MSAILGALGLVFLHTQGTLFRFEWMGSLLWLVPVALSVELTRSAWDKKQARGSTIAAIPAAALFCFIVLHLFSSGVDHGWTYFLEWVPVKPHVACFRAGLVRFVFLTALLWPLFLFRIIKPRPVLWAVLAISQIACLCFLFSKTGGHALYRDDHPSFMFRLLEFSRTYPQLNNYNPYWNGGSVGYAETVSGTTSLGLFLWPLWRYVPIHEAYTYALAFLFIVFVPLVTVGSLRIMGARWSAGICAGILSLGVSMHFFLWLLNYGTVGSCFSLCFIVPFSACVFRVVWLGKTEKWLGVVLVLSAFFLLQWPPGAIMAAPLALSFIISAKRWTRRRVVFLVVCALVVTALYSRTIILFYSEGSSHMDYVLTTPQAESGRNSFLPSAEAVARGWDHLLAHLREGHPVVVFFGILGVFAAPYRSVRRWYIPLIVGLAIAAGWGRELFPKLQISRMAIPLLLAAVVPAGILAGSVLRSAHPRLTVVRAGLTALLLLGGWNVARVYGNENLRTRYVTMSDRLQEIVEWIRENTEPNGRILFAGSTVHAYGGGHVAYLPSLTGREMVSCDYYAFPPDSTEYKMPPSAFQTNPRDVFDYMDLYNVTYTVTYHAKWKEAFKNNREYYREMASFRDMSIFKVLRAPSMFHVGGGRVEADFNVLNVFLDDDHENVVLKYNWIEGMSAPGPVEIYPFEAKHGIKLLGIRPNGARSFRLRYRRWL